MGNNFWHFLFSKGGLFSLFNHPENFPKIALIRYDGGYINPLDVFGMKIITKQHVGKGGKGEYKKLEAIQSQLKGGCAQKNQGTGAKNNSNRQL